MPKVKLNPVFAELRGTLGNIVFKKSSKGTLFIAQRPTKSSTKPSAAQMAHRARFKEAVAYAQAAMADPVQRAAYEEIAAKEGITAFSAASSDYFTGKYLLSKK